MPSAYESSLSWHFIYFRPESQTNYSIDSILLQLQKVYSLISLEPICAAMASSTHGSISDAAQKYTKPGGKVFEYGTAGVGIIHLN